MGKKDFGWDTFVVVLDGILESQALNEQEREVVIVGLENIEVAMPAGDEVMESNPNENPNDDGDSELLMWESLKFTPHQRPHQRMGSPLVKPGRMAVLINPSILST